MGTVGANIFFLLALWWFVHSQRTPIIWLGMIIFVLGLIPIATITSFHPYMLLAIGQSLIAFPLALVGVAVMATGSHLAKVRSPRDDA